METLKRHLRTIGHAAALLFGAWWLVATTAPYTPPRECFKGIGDPATLRVVLGARTPSVEGDPPGCQGLDGLVPGAALTFTLTSAAQRQMGRGGCFLRDSKTIAGVQDVTLSPDPRFLGPEALTIAGGEFASSRSPGCNGGWNLDLAPELVPPSGQMISPLDAGKTGRWFVDRQMWIAARELCDGAFGGTSEVQCEDRFVVESITEVTP